MRRGLDNRSYEADPTRRMPTPMTPSPNRSRLTLLSLAVLGLSSCYLAVEGDELGEGNGQLGGATCALDGKTYAEGESANVDCNTCICTNGSMACTQKACATVSCTHQGKTYQP